MRAIVVGLLLPLCALAATRITVGVIEPKTGKFVTGLKAEDFTVFDDKTPRKVESAEIETGPLDVLLLLDTSLVGAAVQPVAASLIGQLQDKDDMAVISVHSSADIVQEFTSSKELLSRAVQQVKYGNTPRLLDGLYAAIDGGFESAVYRKVVLLLTTGFEGNSRVEEKDVIRLARKNAVSIIPVYLSGSEKSMFEKLARQTGGVVFNLNQLRKEGVNPPGARIFESLRQYYTVTVSGNLSLGEKLRVEVRSPQKLFVSALPQE